MTIEEIKNLVDAGYNLSMFKQYREAFRVLFNRNAPTCNCDAAAVYNRIKNEIYKTEINNNNTNSNTDTTMRKRKLKNPNQTKDPVSGKFQKLDTDKPKPELTKEEFIQQVRSELIQGYSDLERIKKAYQAITGMESANLLIMRRTIINYN